MATKREKFESRVKLSGMFSNLDVFKPIRYDNANDSYIVDETNGKFEVQILVPKASNSGKQLIKDVDNIIAQVRAKKGVKLFYNDSRLSALRDGDDESKFTSYKDYYAGNWVVTLKQNAYNKFTKQPNKIGVYGMRGDNGSRPKITEDDIDLIEEQVYRGVIGVAIGKAYALYEGANKGIFFNISNVVIDTHGNKLDEGESFNPDEIDADEDVINIFLSKLSDDIDSLDNEADEVF